MLKISKAHYGCSTALNKGSALCANGRVIRQDEMENTVTSILQDRLMDPRLVAIFCREYTDRVNRLQMEHNAAIVGYRAELERAYQRSKRIIDMVIDGYGSDTLKRESVELSGRVVELERLQEEHEVPVLLHPHMAVRYRAAIAKLMDALREPASRNEASNLIRGQIEKIEIVPDTTQLDDHQSLWRPCWNLEDRPGG